MLSLNGTGPCGGTEESGQCWHAARPARTTPSLSLSSHRPRRLALLPSSGLRSAGALPRSAGSLVGARSGAGCVGVRPRGSQALALAYASRRPATSSAPSLPSQQLRLQHHHRPAAAPPARPGLLLPQQSNRFQRHLRTTATPACGAGVKNVEVSTTQDRREHRRPSGGDCDQPHARPKVDTDSLKNHLYASSTLPAETD